MRGVRALVVPAYFHPAVAGSHWQLLATHARSVRAVILNAADGPGPTPERRLTAAGVATGRPMLGYVDTDYGRRDLAAVYADIERWRRWYPVSGLFLDRAAADGALLPWYRTVVEFGRRLLPGDVVLNHGVYPAPGYDAVADALVTFEGPYAAYERLVVPDWARETAAERQWHLVYDTPAAQLRTALARAERANAGVVYVTDRAGTNPWDGVPAYLATETSAWCA